MPECQRMAPEGGRINILYISGITTDEVFRHSAAGYGLLCRLISISNQ